MFDFITPPTDLAKRSTNTKIQWLIIIIIKLVLTTFITVTGFAYIAYLIGIFSKPPATPFLLAVTIASAGISLIGAGVSVFLNMRREKLARALEKTKQNLKENFEKEAYKEYLQGKTPFKKKMIEIYFPDFNKEMVIGLEYTPVEGKDDNEIIKGIIYEAFQGMVIRADFKTEENAEEDAQKEQAIGR